DAPAVARQPVRGESRHPGADFGPGVDMGRRVRPAVADSRVSIVADRIAYARKPAAAGTDQCLEHRLNPIAEREIGVADDALRHLNRAVTATCAHRGDAGDELDLADR